jgi:hypothetical protein
MLNDLPTGFCFATGNGCDTDGFPRVEEVEALFTGSLAPLAVLPEGGGKEGDMGKKRSRSDESSSLFCLCFSSLVRFNFLVKAEETCSDWMRRG